jgi:phosphotransferase system HPr (HPr) family protein
LLVAVGSALRRTGVEVAVKGPAGEGWVCLDEGERFFRWARLNPPSSLDLRVTGPDADAVCRDFCSLVNDGDPGCLARAGLIEVPFGRSLSQVDPIAWDRFREQLASPEPEWVYWRVQSQPGYSIYLATSDLRPGDLGEAECWAYCPGEEAARRLRERVSALPRGPATPACTDLWVTKEEHDEAWAWVESPSPLGFHTRPIMAFCNVALRFQAQVTVQYHERTADGRNYMELLLLCLEPGEQFLIRARGSDAAPAVRALAELVRASFLVNLE